MTKLEIPKYEIKDIERYEIRDKTFQNLFEGFNKVMEKIKFLYVITILLVAYICAAFIIGAPTSYFINLLIIYIAFLIFYFGLKIFFRDMSQTVEVIHKESHNERESQWEKEKVFLSPYKIKNVPKWRIEKKDKTLLNAKNTQKGIGLILIGLIISFFVVIIDSLIKNIYGLSYFNWLILIFYLSGFYFFYKGRFELGYKHEKFIYITLTLFILGIILTIAGSYYLIGASNEVENNGMIIFPQNDFSEVANKLEIGLKYASFGSILFTFGTFTLIYKLINKKEKNIFIFAVIFTIILPLLVLVNLNPLVNDLTDEIRNSNSRSEVENTINNYDTDSSLIIFHITINLFGKILYILGYSFLFLKIFRPETEPIFEKHVEQRPIIYQQINNNYYSGKTVDPRLLLTKKYNSPKSKYCPLCGLPLSYDLEYDKMRCGNCNRLY